MKVLVRVLGTLLLVGLILTRVNLGQIMDSFATLRPAYWVAAFLLLFFTQVLSCQRWKVLATAVGFGGTFYEYLKFFFIGMFFNLALPTSVGGDVVRAWYLAYKMKDDLVENRRSKAVLTVFADRFSGVLVLVAIAVIATIFSPVELPVWVKGTVMSVGLGAIGSLAMLPLIAKFSVRFPKLLVVLKSAKLCFGNAKVLVLTTAMSVWVQLSSVSIMMLIGLGMDLPIPLPFYFVMVPLVTLMTMLPISLGGMGLREGATVLMLTPLAIAPASAVALSVLCFSVYVAVEMIGIFFYLGSRGSATSSDMKDVQLEGEISGSTELEESHDGSAIRNNTDQRRAG